MGAAELKSFWLARPRLREVYFAIRTARAVLTHPLRYAGYWAWFLRARWSRRRVVLFRSFHPSDRLTFADLPERLAESDRYAVAWVADHEVSQGISRTRAFCDGGDFLPAVRADLYVLCTSNTHRFMPRGAQSMFLFPSLAGLDGLYADGAFDSYDAFFCAGPHQHREMQARLEERGIAHRPLFAGGYPKLDRLRADCGRITRPAAETSTVLYAPTHCHKNAFSSLPVAEKILRSLRDAGFRVLFRPHPKSFDIAEERPVLDAVLAATREDTGIELDHDGDAAQTYARADLVVSDGTGVGFSFAFATDRPALFVDRGACGSGFHFESRESVGRVCHAAEEVGTAARALLDGPSYEASISKLRGEVVYNVGTSSNAFVECAHALLSRGRPARTQSPPSRGPSPSRTAPTIPRP